MLLRRRTAGDEAALPGSLHPVLRRLYASRGASAEQISLDAKNLLPPEGLKGIAEAAQLLATAIRQQQKIIIAGDYDCDGATGCALAVLGLSALGARAPGYVVPDRFVMGYGLSPALVERACAQGAELLVTVDNGIASLPGVAHAKARGLVVIVTDHHLPGPELPVADAIVNPNQPGCGFASKSIAGVGVMFYLLLAVRAALRASGAWQDQPQPNLAELLDLVALGTVADVVRLDANNRILVEQGLRRIRAGRARPGLKALLTVAGRSAEHLSATDLGFVLGPRLNAAGRLEDMRAGIECLLAASEDAALPLARQLDALNRERRALQGGMSEVALAQIEADDRVGLCAFEPDWHEGIVGLIAAKMKEARHRPCIAFARAQQAGVLKGSARSIAGLNVRDALAAVDARHPGLIERFGGHAMAAGLTLAEACYAEFAAAFDAACRRLLDPKDLERALETDGELGSAQLTLATALALDQAGPWGQGFPAPLFEGEFTVAETRLMGSEQQHVRYRLRSADGALLEAVEFGGGERARAPGSRLRVAYETAVNRWRNAESLQLLLRHIE